MVCSWAEKEYFEERVCDAKRAQLMYISIVLEISFYPHYGGANMFTFQIPNIWQGHRPSYVRIFDADDEVLCQKNLVCEMKEYYQDKTPTIPITDLAVLCVAELRRRLHRPYRFRHPSSPDKVEHPNKSDQSEKLSQHKTQDFDCSFQWVEHKFVNIESIRCQFVLDHTDKKEAIKTEQCRHLEVFSVLSVLFVSEAANVLELLLEWTH